MNKKTLVIVLIVAYGCISLTRVAAQENTFVLYYDSLWKQCPKEQAFFYSQFVKQGTLYNCTSYWLKSNQVFKICTYADTVHFKHIGKRINFYENGIVSDSIQFENDGKLGQKYHYAKDGRPEYHAFYDLNSDSWLGENLDSTGKKIPGYFIYQKVAKFPGGPEAWQRYLQDNLRASIATQFGAPPGNYTVVVSFLVDKEGKINEVEATNDPGYGTADEAVRVIKQGPLWNPAVQNDNKVIYRQKQSITFQVGK